MAVAGWNRIPAAAMVAALLALQRLVGVHATGAARLYIGHALSLALCAAVLVLASSAVGRRAHGRAATARPINAVRVHILLTLLLLLSAFPNETARYMALLPRRAPTTSLVVVIGFWIALVIRFARRGYSPAWMLVGFVGLTAGTRLLTMSAQPFHRLDGDMLATIDRSLNELLAGRFPYLDFPPPMPYLPVTFLAYLPPKLLGLDLRWTNLIVDAAAVGATFCLARRLAERGRPASPDCSPLLNQLLLPCLMLHPVWVQHGANSQYAPCLFLTMLLGFAVLFENHKAQAVALGLVVGSNQMLAACGPILFAHWLGRVGARRAAGLAVVSAAVFLAVITPFLLWEPGRFVEVAFLSRNRFDDALMAGRFTLLPLASRLIPRAVLVGSAMALAAAAWVVLGSRRPSTAGAAMAAGLCAALMFQPVSFAHYFLPAVVLASVIPSAPVVVGRQSLPRGPRLRRAGTVAEARVSSVLSRRLQ